MNQRALIAAATAITALILVLFALVVPGLSKPTTAPAPTAVKVPTSAAQPQAKPTSAAQPQAKPTSAAQPQAQPTSAAQPQTSPATYPISADQASTIALARAVGATLAGTPAIVTYQGVVAYEVPLNTGMAYVDATSGNVLSAPGAANTNAGSAPTSGGAGDEGDDDDDDDD